MEEDSAVNTNLGGTMAFDFKKEYKEFYMPKNKPEIVNVPKANYIAVRGKGNPNEYSCAVKPPFRDAGYRRSRDGVPQIV